MYSATIHPLYSKPRVRTGTTVPLQDYIICAIVAFLDLQLHMLSMKEIIPLYSIPVLVMPSGNKMHRIWSTFLLLMWSIPEVYILEDIVKSNQNNEVSYFRCQINQEGNRR